jgi:CHAD domain-containing protein
MTTSATETERKYEAPAGSAAPRLTDLPGVANTAGPEEQVLEAEYFDTDDLRLLRNGITLRRRQGGNDAGWHLKLPAAKNTRREIRLPLGRGRQVPRQLAELVRVYSRNAPLRPVARISTRRQLLTLLDNGGGSLAEIAADDISAQSLGSETAISAWGEVEVELTGGGPRLLKAADAQLRQNGLRPSARSAKLERALAGRLPADGHAQPAPDGSAGAAVLAYFRQHTAAMKAQDPMVRRDEPDSVHQMRVASRRLRSTLQSFGVVIPRPSTAELVAELKWLGGVLGEARDAEVLAGRLRRRVQDLPAELVLGPVEARIQGHFAPVAAAARKEVLAALDSPRYFALLDMLDELLADPPLTPEAGLPAGDVLPGSARRAYRRADRRLRRARHTPAGPRREAAYHDARKSAKRARYAGEAATPAIGPEAARFTKQMKKIQSVLGDQHDAIVARGVDRELGISAHLAGENAFTYGLLYQEEDQLAGQLPAEAWQLWKHASRPHFRRWASLG